MHKVVYILSASHSGSTLLAMLLGAHREACTIGELKLENLGDIGAYRCSCGSLIMECEFWAKIRSGMRDEQSDFTLNDPGTSIYKSPGRYSRKLLEPLHREKTLELLRDSVLLLSPTWRMHLNRFSSNYRKLVSTVLGISGAHILVDSSKQALQLKYILRIQQLDVKVLRLLRDGRAVALTGIDKATFADAVDPTLRYGGTGNHDGSTDDTMAQATRNWSRSNEAADSVVRRLDPSRWIQIRYEDMCENPQVLLEDVCGFLGLDIDGIRMDFRGVENHVVGNGMRFDKSSDINKDERWKEILTGEDLRCFERMAGNLNRSYGYD